MQKLQGAKPVIVFIHMDGCGFCKRAQEQVYTPYLAMRHPYVELCDINLRNCQGFCQHHGVTGFPTFVTNYEGAAPKFHAGYKAPEIMDRILAAARARGMRAVVSPTGGEEASTEGTGAVAQRAAALRDMTAQEAMALLKSKAPAIVAVVAPWCGFCKKLKEEGVMEKVKAAFPNLVVGFVDGTKPENKAIVDMLSAETNGRFGYPTLVHTLVPPSSTKTYDVVSGYRPFKALYDMIAAKMAGKSA